MRGDLMTSPRDLWTALLENEMRDLNLTSAWFFREREGLWTVSLHVRDHATRYRGSAERISVAFQGAADLCMQETCQDKRK